MRIVFMGTPDFAVPCLQRILADGHEVPAVFTQPDKPVGRHAVLTPPPVKQLAQERGIPVYQPTKMRDGTVAAQLKELAPDCLVVVAYGRILPQAILDVSIFTAPCCPNTGAPHPSSGASSTGRRSPG